MESRWQEFRVFTGDRLSLLKHGFPPFRRELGGEMERFFYVLYGEGGRHIRIRVQVAHGIPSSRVQDAIGRYFGRYEQVEYRPETQRYGGEVGMQYAHRSFDESSRFVLDHLSCNRGNERRHAVPLAAVSQLATMFAAKFSTVQLIEFSEVLRDLWANTIAGVTGRAVELPSRSWFSANLLEKVARVWREYARTRGELKELSSYIFAHQQILQSFSELFSINSQMTVAGNLQMALAQKASLSESDSRLLTVIANLIHMHNNRLGLSNGQEAIVSQLLVSAVKG